LKNWFIFSPNSLAFSTNSGAISNCLLNEGLRSGIGAEGLTARVLIALLIRHMIGLKFDSGVR
jgi:hypothetical protein